MTALFAAKSINPSAMIDAMKNGDSPFERDETGMSAWDYVQQRWTSSAGHPFDKFGKQCREALYSMSQYTPKNQEEVAMARELGLKLTAEMREASAHFIKVTTINDDPTEFVMEKTRENQKKAEEKYRGISEVHSALMNSKAWEMAWDIPPDEFKKLQERYDEAMGYQQPQTQKTMDSNESGGLAQNNSGPSTPIMVNQIQNKANPGFVSVMGAPGLAQKWNQNLSVNDDLAEKTLVDMRQTSQVADATMAELLEQADKIFSDPNATREEITEIGQRLIRAQVAVKETTKGLEEFEQAQSKQQESIQALNGATAENAQAWHRGDEWARAAADYYASAGQSFARASDRLAQEPLLTRALNKIWPGQTDAENTSKFWDGVANIQLNLAVLAQRAVALPGLIKQNLAKGAMVTLQTIQAGADAFVGLAQREYMEMREGLDQIKEAGMSKIRAVNDGAGHVMDILGAVGDTAYGRAKEADQWMENNISTPIVNFVSNGFQTMKSWVAKAREVGEEIGARMEADFKTSLAERIQARRKSDEALAPTAQDPQTETPRGRSLGS